MVIVADAALVVAVGVLIVDRVNVFDNRSFQLFVMAWCKNNQEIEEIKIG